MVLIQALFGGAWPHQFTEQQCVRAVMTTINRGIMESITQLIGGLSRYFASIRG